MKEKALKEKEEDTHKNWHKFWGEDTVDGKIDARDRISYTFFIKIHKNTCKNNKKYTSHANMFKEKIRNLTDYNNNTQMTLQTKRIE